MSSLIQAMNNERLVSGAVVFGAGAAIARYALATPQAKQIALVMAVAAVAFVVIRAIMALVAACKTGLPASRVNPTGGASKTPTPPKIDGKEAENPQSSSGAPVSSTAGAVPAGTSLPAPTPPAIEVVIPAAQTPAPAASPAAAGGSVTFPPAPAAGEGVKAKLEAISSGAVSNAEKKPPQAPAAQVSEEITAAGAGVGGGTRETVPAAAPAAGGAGAPKAAPVGAGSKK